MTDSEAFEAWWKQEAYAGDMLATHEANIARASWHAALASERAKQNAATNVGIDWANPATLNGVLCHAVQADASDRKVVADWIEAWNNEKPDGRGWAFTRAVELLRAAPPAAQAEPLCTCSMTECVQGGTGVRCRLYAAPPVDPAKRERVKQLVLWLDACANAVDLLRSDLSVNYKEIAAILREEYLEAKPVDPVAPQQSAEPVAWIAKGPGGGVYHLAKQDGWTVDPVVFASPAAQAEPARHEHERGAPLTSDCDNWCRAKYERYERAKQAEPVDVTRDPRVLLAACLLHPLPLALANAIKEILAAPPADDKAVRLLRRLMDCEDLSGWSGPSASPLCDEIDAYLAKVKQ